MNKRKTTYGYRKQTKRLGEQTFTDDNQEIVTQNWIDDEAVGVRLETRGFWRLEYT